MHQTQWLLLALTYSSLHMMTLSHVILDLLWTVKALNPSAIGELQNGTVGLTSSRNRLQYTLSEDIRLISQPYL
jgi:hypothetical protein